MQETQQWVAVRSLSLRPQRPGFESRMYFFVRVPFSFFFFKQKTAYEILSGLVGSEMCIRDRYKGASPRGASARLGSAHARNYRGCRQIEAVNATQYCQGVPSKINRV